MEEFMKLKSIVSFLIVTLLLAACSTKTATPTQPVVTENPTVPATQASQPTQSSLPTQPGPATAYPAPLSGTPLPTISAYPEPGTAGTDSQAIPISGYEPQPGDEKLKRDQVSLDLAKSQLAVTVTEVPTAKAVLVGTMPDPCHSLRVVVTPADANNTISLDVYSLVDASTACVTVIEPFTASIPLGSFSTGRYTVLVNGESLGQFDTVYAPQPADDKLTRDVATVDFKTSTLSMTGTQPNDVSANLKGTLPDPCHQLRIVLTPADAQNKINLEVYSVYDPKATCTTVIQPFNVIFPLGSFPSGHYTVYVNGEDLGEFDG
jgi:hypothetical protein